MIIAYDVEFPVRPQKSGNIVNDVLEFSSSNAKNVELEVKEDQKAVRIAANYATVIRRKGLNGAIRVRKIGNRVFLEKK